MTLSKREFLTLLAGGTAGVALGQRIAGDTEGGLMGVVGGGETATTVTADGAPLPVIVGTSLEAARDEVDTRPALLLVTDTQSTYISEAEASGTNTIETQFKMNLIVADTIEAAKSEIDTYPALVVGRTQQSISLVEGN